MTRIAENEILIWGAGAMGGTIGACLARAGHPVRFVDRVREHVDRIRDPGLEITGPVDAFRIAAPGSQPSELTGTWKTVLLCVKSHHTREAAGELAPHLHPDGCVVSIQNGLNEATIAEVVGAHRTVGAFVNFGADYLAPGRIHWGGRGAVVVGEIDGQITDRARRLHAILRDFEPDAVLTDAIQGFLWGKLAYAALLFATALTDDSIADCLADPEFRPVFAGLGREVVSVARAARIPLRGFDGFDPAAFDPDAHADRADTSLNDLVAFNRRSAKTHSGIWRDLAVRKRKTEVDAQLGPVSAEGSRLSVPTPLVDAVIRMIHDIESGVRDRARANLRLLQLIQARGEGPAS